MWFHKMTRILFLACVLVFVEVDTENLEEESCKGVTLEEPYSLAVKSSIINTDYRWPQNTVVYSIITTFPYKETFYNAMKHITGRTCIRFRERLNETNYVHVMQDRIRGDCYYRGFGMNGGQQNLSLARGCGQLLRHHIHELVHALGFWHEHMRTDRDQFVTINAENVREGDEINFDKINASYYSSFGVPYDYSSIVHYKRNGLSIDDKDTITPLDPHVTIGYAEGLSHFDIRKINNLYCAGTIGIRIKNLADGMYLTVGNDTETGRPLQGSNWTGGENQNFTVDWYALRNRSRGSPLVSWSQDAAEFVNAMIEVDSTISVWGERNTTYDKWWVDRVLFTKDTRWQIVSSRSGKCVVSMGTSQAMTTPCNKSDPNQLWKIFNV